MSRSMMLLQVLERQKLLETADGMGGNSGNRQAADQKVDNDSGGDGMVVMVEVVTEMDVMLMEVLNGEGVQHSYVSSP